MTVAHGLALLLSLIVVVSCLRLLWRQRRTSIDARMPAWRLLILLLAQPLLAALLYFTLWPPAVKTQAGTLVVRTAQAGMIPQGEQTGEVQISLPEASPQHDTERMPDLATALRRHPGSRHLRIVGAGLEARDREGLDGLAIEYFPNALPAGVIELQLPEQIAAGGAFQVHGRVHGLAGGSLALIDPGMHVVDQQAVSKDGRFVLTGSVRVPGEMEFSLRASDAGKQVRENLILPLQVHAHPAPRLLLLAGAPGPEVKYLRRWASDAGLPLHAQMSVGAGGNLGDAPIALNAASLRNFDLLLIDDRAWSNLGASARAAVQQATRDGLGVLLRVTGPLSAAQRAQWRGLGFALGGGNERVDLRLPEAQVGADLLRARQGPGTADAPNLPDATPAGLPVLSRHSPSMTGKDAVVLLRDQAGMAVAQWRVLGLGRLGVWTMADSYRLVLGGREDRYGELWSQALATLARARALPASPLQGVAWQGQRVVLCGLNAHARVIAPDGAPVSLQIDPATGARACAAFWPTQSGWYQLMPATQASAGQTPTDQPPTDQTQAFFVRAADSAPALQAYERQQVNQQLALQSSSDQRAGHGIPRRGSSWPWLLAWLACASLLWWFERSRRKPALKF